MVTFLRQLVNLATFTFSSPTGTSCNIIRFHSASWQQLKYHLYTLYHQDSQLLYLALSKLLRITAYTCRFATNCRKQQEDRLKGPLYNTIRIQNYTMLRLDGWSIARGKFTLASISFLTPHHSRESHLQDICASSWMQMAWFIVVAEYIMHHWASLLYFPSFYHQNTYWCHSLSNYSVYCQMFHAGTNTIPTV